MNMDLASEIEEFIELLAKSGFFSSEEILEILEDEFIEEDIDFSKFDIPLNNSSNINFQNLESIFKNLASENIVAIHNCGYDISEGVNDAFELYIHLVNNKFHPEGFCFYTFGDVENAISDKKLMITFGDFEKNESKALEIGKIVANYLKKQFEIKWDESINSQIIITPFEWDKSFDANKTYEIEGAYEIFTNEG